MNEGVLEAVEPIVRDLVRSRGLDPLRDDPRSFDRLVDGAIADYERRVEASVLPRIEDRQRLHRDLLARVAGAGPLQSLLDDPEVEEIWVNGPGKVFCAKGGRHVLTNVVVSDDEVRGIVERLLRASGRRLDLSSPFVDAMLADGSRLHVVIPDITHRHWAVNIRKFVVRATNLEDLVALGSISAPAARFLDASVRAGLNIVVSGSTQAGKTTMLNCLIASIPAGDRVVTCEEVFELQPSLPDVVAMQTRQTNLEGRGSIDLRRLIIEALRMRPDRLVVGEVREREALDLLVALNSGLPGMTSIHANSAAEAVVKLTTLPLLAGENVTHSFVVPTVAACVDLVVHLAVRRGMRRTVEIVGLSGRSEGAQIELTSLWKAERGDLRWTGDRIDWDRRFAEAGMNLAEFLR
ncbi:MAG TPA: ATPase, T2SS/T4P/T4SS family [Actinomycetota bacterium]|nr:ATPase, T2SS/T4P/T4SS family [Actinomycetota bacterium]